MRLRRQRGVTLIELLVVLTILAFLAALIALNASPPRSGAKDEAERFAARMRLAFEAAALDGAIYSVRLAPGEYRIEKLAGGAWQPAQIGRLSSEWRAPKALSMTAVSRDPARLNERPAEGEPLRIILDPIGMTTPFTVEFADRTGAYAVSNSADETIKVARRD